MIPSIRNRKVQIVAQSVVISALVGGTGAFLALNKPVNVTVDGEAEQVRSFGSTVDDVLAAQDITLDERDQVQPSRSTQVERDMNIVVNKAKDLDLTVDGKPMDEWTNASTVGQALADLGIEHEGAEVSAALDDKISDGETIDVTTAKTVSVMADGKTQPVEAAAKTVQDVISEAGIELGTDDITSAPLTSNVYDGQVVNVMRVVNEEKTETETIKKKVTVKKDSSLPRGEKKVEKKGKDGKREVVFKVRTVNGDEVSREEVSSKDIEKPVEEVVVEGTKAPEKKRQSDKSSRSKDDSGSGGSDNSEDNYSGSMTTAQIKEMLGGPGSKWYSVVKCESNFNPRAINQSNRAHFGLFQFKLATWRSVGGSGNPIDASPQEQFKRAKILQKKAGWGQWACA
ncbi:resuscitation-promoting factor [Brevibacterium luteolum]|uniref:resuscitation-promoting factor n=1 Tax=Brevibacterium luteolum TaxID=199591 RepID=UPI00223BEFF8|nr:resuscitation-promoting factor [Brevibacterium luteolum]MCT1829390.1 ubiquitin-like domain-containing protein [Brevibacterium luteolum]